MQGGKLNISSDRAKKGDTVTVTVLPDKGYMLDTLTVTDAAGKLLKLTAKGKHQYTFIMPGSKVKAEATFKPADANPFTDIRETDHFYEAVLWAVANGITNGTTETTFSPHKTCTRAQTVTFLWRAMGSPEPITAVNPFTDVDESAYYYKAVLWAVENGITNGLTATSFAPDDTVKRSQTVTFLWRAAGKPMADTVNPFADVPLDAYYHQAVLWAGIEGITNGTSKTTFSPVADCTRGQIVKFLYGYMT